MQINQTITQSIKPSINQSTILINQTIYPGKSIYYKMSAFLKGIFIINESIKKTSQNISQIPNV